MDANELAFLLVGGAGFVLLIVGLLLGELFEIGADHGIDIGGDTEAGGPSWISTKML